MKLFKRKAKLTFTDEFLAQLFIGPSQKPTKIDVSFNPKTYKLRVYADGEEVDFL
jgi:hypothetical protein